MPYGPVGGGEGVMAAAGPWDWAQGPQGQRRGPTRAARSFDLGRSALPATTHPPRAVPLRCAPRPGHAAACGCGSLSSPLPVSPGPLWGPPGPRASPHCPSPCREAWQLRPHPAYLSPGRTHLCQASFKGSGEAGQAGVLRVCGGSSFYTRSCSTCSQLRAAPVPQPLPALHPGSGCPQGLAGTWYIHPAAHTGLRGHLASPSKGVVREGGGAGGLVEFLSIA